MYYTEIILSYCLADCFEFRACLAARCVCAAKNINKYSNKPDNRYERIIQRFYEDLATSENC